AIAVKTLRLFVTLPLVFGAVFVIMVNNWIAILAYLCFILLFIFVSAYIDAGHFGMAKEATATGKTGSNHFWLYGKRFFRRILTANIIMLIIEGAALIFLVPAVYILFKYNVFHNLSAIFYNLISYDIPNLMISLENMLSPFVTSPFAITVLLISIPVGLVLILVYRVIVSVLFFFVGYNIVADDLSVIGSYKKSVSLLKVKPFHMLLFIFICFLISFIFSAAAGLIAGLFGFIPGLGLIVSSLLNIIFSTILATFSVVWIMRYYMVLTEKPLYAKEK
ncbi:MAG: hypothetical protein FWH46_02035, partial [Methanimicrococcus sp.]|nr:hypothetical protein [Methanimicrococcus sp.]